MLQYKQSQKCTKIFESTFTYLSVSKQKDNLFDIEQVALNLYKYLTPR